MLDGKREGGEGEGQRAWKVRFLAASRKKRAQARVAWKVRMTSLACTCSGAWAAMRESIWSSSSTRSFISSIMLDRRFHTCAGRGAAAGGALPPGPPPAPGASRCAGLPIPGQPTIRGWSRVRSCTGLLQS